MISADETGSVQGGAGVQRIAAIPTVYRGVQFRSRLEARWAAFFDQLGWPWDYEPIDLDGYIPDFVLPFRHAPLLAEIKPTATYQVGGELRQHTEKIVRSGWQKEALLLGSRIGILAPGNEALSGIIGTRQPIDGALEWMWDDARIFWCVPCEGFSIHESNGSWRCRRCGTDERWARGHAEYHLLGAAWNESGNAVQWRRPT